MIRRLPAVLLISSLTACTQVAPIPVDQAMVECRDIAGQSTKPSGSVGIGVNSAGKVSTGLSIALTSDFIAQRSPQEVFERCVVKKAGSPPTEPYALEATSQPSSG